MLDWDLAGRPGVPQVADWLCATARGGAHTTVAHRDRTTLPCIHRYQMVVGEVPFDARNLLELYDKISEAKITVRCAFMLKSSQQPSASLQAYYL